MIERKDVVTFKGGSLTLVGPEAQVGAQAPNFTVLDNDLKPLTLADFKGKTLLIVSVPSLDTPVCDLEARRFNEEAAKLSPSVRILVISMDLPFAQKRWCGAEGVKNVVTLSDYRGASFGMAYGVLIRELRLLARAVFVVDRQGVIRYVQIVPELSQEPDYAPVLAAVAELTRG